MPVGPLPLAENAPVGPLRPTTAELYPGRLKRPWSPVDMEIAGQHAHQLGGVAAHDGQRVQILGGDDVAALAGVEGPLMESTPPPR